jgi:hypothetical protein
MISITERMLSSFNKMPKIICCIFQCQLHYSSMRCNFYAHSIKYIIKILPISYPVRFICSSTKRYLPFRLFRQQ